MMKASELTNEELANRIEYPLMLTAKEYGDCCREAAARLRRKANTMASEIIRYTPQFYNDYTKEWMKVKYGKGAYPSKAWALAAISQYGRQGCKHRLMIEKLTVADVSFEEVDYDK